MVQTVEKRIESNDDINVLKRAALPAYIHSLDVSQFGLVTNSIISKNKKNCLLSSSILSPREKTQMRVKRSFFLHSHRYVDLGYQSPPPPQTFTASSSVFLDLT